MCAERVDSVRQKEKNVHMHNIWLTERKTSRTKEKS
jgi:hypothetical protein